MTDKNRPWVDYTYQAHKTDDSGGTDPGNVIVPPNTSSSTPYQYCSFPEQFHGDDKSGYRTLIKARSNATNAAFGQRAQLYASGFSADLTRWVNPFWHDRGTLHYSVYGTLPIDNVVSAGAVDSEAVNRARIAFVNAAINAMHSEDGGQFLGEIREAFDTIKHPLQGIKDGLGQYLSDVKRLRKGLKRSGVVAKRKVLAQSWLEAQYAIKPLISDVTNIAQGLASLQFAQKPNIRIHGRGASLLPVASGGGQITESALQIDYSTSVHDRSEITFFGAVTPDSSSGASNPARLLDAMGLTFDRFVPTVWALIPYSFVVDYFSTVGRVIDAVSLNKSRLAYYGSTTKVSRIYSSKISGLHGNVASDPAYISSALSPGETRLVVDKFTRALEVELVPPLEFHLPYSGWQALNLTALLYQAKSITPF